MLKPRPRKSTPTRRVRASKGGYRIPGGGYAALVKPVPEFRGTTRQTCGLWPYVTGSGAPLMGVPQGPDLSTGSHAGLDIITMFRERIIGNPSCGISALPNHGKSALVKHTLAGHDAFGDVVRILGDVKDEYAPVIEAMGGTVVHIGPGRGVINPLDPGNAYEAVARIRAEADRVEAEGQGSEESTERVKLLHGLAVKVMEDLHARQTALVSGLITISRRQPLSEREETVLDNAIRLLRERMGDEIPVLKDLLEIIVEGPELLHHVAISRGDDARYQQITEDLEASLRGLTSGGIMGTIFSGHTTARPRVDQHACWSLASIGDERPLMQAGAMLAVWSHGFGDVNVAHALSDAGLEKEINFALILDEFWRALSLGMGLVAKVNSMTRLNRNEGVGIYYIFHTFRDFQAIRDPQDREMAKEFLTRCGLLIIGGQRAKEIGEINAIAQLTDQEAEQIISWGDSPKLSSIAADLDLDFEDEEKWSTGEDVASVSRRALPGQGKFLFKAGSRPGIAVDIKLTPTELRRKITDTDTRWEMVA